MRERSFRSYIRRALISKSEGCSRTVTTLHQTRSVTAKRAVRRLYGPFYRVSHYDRRESSTGGVRHKSFSFTAGRPHRSTDETSVTPRRRAGDGQWRRFYGGTIQHISISPRKGTRKHFKRLKRAPSLLRRSKRLPISAGRSIDDASIVAG